VYWDIVTPAALAERDRAASAERARRLDLDRRTIDRVHIGDAASERAHDLQGERMETGDAGGRPWRHALDGGWLSYRLAVGGREPRLLSVTYWGSDSGARTFDVLVNGRLLETERLDNNRPGHFYDKAYPLAADTADRDGAITVTFQAHPGNRAGGIYGVRVVTPAMEPQ
jgi:hypothetical protein